MNNSWRISAILFQLAVLLSARADVAPHAMFSDNAVLQQQIPVPVWGTAGDGENITVEFQDQKVSTVAKDGRWRVTLQPLQAGGPFEMRIAAQSNSVTIKNILVGEVWVCSGQSNMAMGLGDTENAEQAKATADDPLLRFFQLPWTSTRDPQRDIPPARQARWSPGSDAYHAHMFSAVGYYFGRDLRKARNVPVGLIQSSVGGTFAECWIPLEYLQADPVLKPTLDRWPKQIERYQAALAQYQKDEPELKRQYEAALTKALAEGAKPPRPPAPPTSPEQDPRNQTAGLYNAMIAPLQPYAIRGVAWYQGENNAGIAWEYRTTLPTLIRSWRETWQQGEFPFLIVQLAPYGQITDEVRDSTWSELLEAQLLTSKTVPNTALITTTDCGDAKVPTNIHPPRKAPIGARLALAARALAHGEPIVYSGPIYDSVTIDGPRAIVRFKHIGGGLVTDGSELKGFTIAADDKKFRPATAQIRDDTVVVSSPQVPTPVAVRYGWADHPIVNLFNKEGLPAAPFRTDDFPMLTQPR